MAPYSPMISRVPIGVAVPQTFKDGPVEPARIKRVLMRAEQLGFHSAWVIEQVLGSIPCLDAVETLAFGAAVTERMKLGTAVLLTAIRNPVNTAKSLATIDQLSGGRLIVGIGLGGSTRVYPFYGLGAERRVRRFVDGLRVMKALWTEPRVTMSGEFFDLREVPMQPKPAQKPHPPIWFGGQHPNALRRAVELGDGFIGAGSVPIAAFLDQAKFVSTLLAEAGRDRTTFTIGKRVYIAVDHDRGRAAKRLADWFGAFYGKPGLAEQVSVWGDAEACLAELRRIVDGGAQFLMLHPVFDEEEHLEIFANDIGPRL